MSYEYKECKDCAEVIKAAARVCRFCRAEYTEEELKEEVKAVKSELVSAGEMCPKCEGMKVKYIYVETFGRQVHWCYDCKDALENMNYIAVMKTKEGVKPKPITTVSAPAPEPTRPAVAPETSAYVKGEIICANAMCGYRGKPKKRRRGSIIILIILLCAGLLPGLVYYLLAFKKDTMCPRCGQVISSDRR